MERPPASVMAAARKLRDAGPVAAEGGMTVEKFIAALPRDHADAIAELDAFLVGDNLDRAQGRPGRSADERQAIVNERVRRMQARDRG